MADTFELQRLLTTAGLSRRLDQHHATTKRRLIERAVRADGISLPTYGLLYDESRLEEIRKAICDQAPEAVSANTEPQPKA